VRPGTEAHIGPSALESGWREGEQTRRARTRAWPEAIFCGAEKAARRLRLVLQGTPELLSRPKLHGLVRAIWYMAYNGQPHDIKRDN